MRYFAAKAAFWGGIFVAGLCPATKIPLEPIREFAVDTLEMLISVVFG